MKCFFISILMFSFSFLFSAQEYRTGELFQSEILDNSTEKEFLSIDEDKLFLNPDKIFVTNDGIFLETPMGLIELSTLYSCSQGVYTKYSEVDSTVYPVIKCKNCGLPFNPNFYNKGRCPNCGTQN